CLLSGGSSTPTWGSCAAAVADSILWQQVDGTAQLKNTTLDLLVGGTSTASAKFAVLNVNGTGPVTATVSGNLIVMPTNGAGGRVGIGTTNPLTTVQVGAGNVLPAHAGGSYGSGTQDLSINKLSGESSLGVMVSD